MSLDKSQKQNILLDRLKNISVSKKALIFVFSMSAIGMAVGTIDSKIALGQCSDSPNCEIENPAKMQLGKISMGTCAGMVAAALLSIPAVLTEED